MDGEKSHEPRMKTLGKKMDEFDFIPVKDAMGQLQVWQCYHPMHGNTIANHATISIDLINAVKDAHGHSYRTKKNLSILYMSIYEFVG